MFCTAITLRVLITYILRSCSSVGFADNLTCKRIKVHQNNENKSLLRISVCTNPIGLSATDTCMVKVPGKECVGLSGCFSRLLRLT